MKPEPQHNPFSYYAHRYNEPIQLRPDDADQKVIDAIKADLEARGQRTTGSNIIRAALRAWVLESSEDESAPPPDNR